MWVLYRSAIFWVLMAIKKFGFHFWFSSNGFIFVSKTIGAEPNCANQNRLFNYCQAYRQNRQAVQNLHTTNLL
jgi:hypothetical protein